MVTAFNSMGPINYFWQTVDTKPFTTQQLPAFKTLDG